MSRKTRYGLSGSQRQRRANLPQKVILRPISYYASGWTSDSISKVNENIVAINPGDGVYVSATSGQSSNVQAYYLNYFDVPGANTPPLYMQNSRAKRITAIRVWAYVYINGGSTNQTMQCYVGFGGYGTATAMAPQVVVASWGWVTATVPVNIPIQNGFSGSFSNQPVVGVSINLGKSQTIYLDTLYAEYIGDIE